LREESYTSVKLPFYIKFSPLIKKISAKLDENLQGDKKICRKNEKGKCIYPIYQKKDNKCIYPSNYELAQLIFAPLVLTILVFVLLYYFLLTIQIRELSKILSEMGMRLNGEKTYHSDDIVNSSNNMIIHIFV
jgi:uncharacterized membrane protein (DUF106 family)